MISQGSWEFMGKVSYLTVKFGGHRPSGSRDIMVSVCHLTMQNHEVNELYDFIAWSPSR